MLERVDRKSLIYEMGGSGAYAATHVVGCSHGCRFPCYAFLMMRRFGKVATYEEWCRPRLVGNALKLAQRELPRLRGTAHSISLSFATDAFMYNQPEVTELTLRLTRLINSYDIPVHSYSAREKKDAAKTFFGSPRRAIYTPALRIIGDFCGKIAPSCRNPTVMEYVR